MSKNTSVTLLVFTFNEIDGMRVVMPQINRQWADQILIVDGGSTDGTIEYAQQQGFEVHVQRQKGLGPAFLESLPLVRGEYFIAFTPDGNSLAEKIPELIAKVSEGYDVVIASRYVAGAKSEDDDIVTRFGNWMFTRLINALFATKVSDGLVMYRAYRTQQIRALGIDTVTVAWGTQVLTRAAKSRYKIAEIPASEPPRVGGVRKMRPFYNGMAELKMILQEFIKRNAK